MNTFFKTRTAVFIHIWRFYGHKINTLADIELQNAENKQFNSIYQINVTCPKILMFGQVVGQNWPSYSYMELRFLVLTRPLLGRIFCWNSEEFHLLNGRNQRFYLV